MGIFKNVTNKNVPDIYKAIFQYLTDFEICRTEQDPVSDFK